jgi:hypothetical protein
VPVTQSGALNGGRLSVMVSFDEVAICDLVGRLGDSPLLAQSVRLPHER